ncbi:hypothetical protein ACFE04_000162 [Oxalis oulophora]
MPSTASGEYHHRHCTAATTRRRPATNSLSITNPEGRQQTHCPSQTPMMSSQTHCFPMMSITNPLPTSRRSSQPPTIPGESTAAAIFATVIGLIEESKLDTFNIPFYEPYVDEVKDLIESEGSFMINRLETFRHSWYANMDDGDTRLVFDNHAKAKYVAHRIRAAGEPIVASHFGGEIMDDLFHRFCHNALGVIEQGQGFVNNVVISMTRK